MIHLDPYNISLVASACTALFLVLSALFKKLNSSKLTSTTPLSGPPRKSLFGVTRQIRVSPNPKAFYEEWFNQYGTIYRIPLPFGTEAVVISDLKAATHIFAKDTFTYVRSAGLRLLIERLIGRGLLFVEGDDHRKQRRILNTAFSSRNIKNMTPVIYDTAYRLKNEWEKIIDSSPTGLKGEIDLHEWATKLTLDVIGRVAFGHEFHALQGKYSSVEEALQMFNTTSPAGFGMLLYAASVFVPWVGMIPTKRNRLLNNLSDSTRRILERLIKEKESSNLIEKPQKGERSLLELLVDAESSGSGRPTQESKDEIVAQMKAILIAGTDPPSLATVWTLLEIARNPEVQTRLRQEINASPGAELDWNHLQSSCPLLDAVISEVLRMRPSFGETPRVANEDDILPLKEPMIDASGKLVDRIHIAKGTKIIIPNHFLNCSPSIWGSDAHEFNPDRWLDDPVLKADRNPDDITSARLRLWSFGEGPRVCVGRVFALTQLKIVLAILLRDFMFELADGPGTPIDIHFSLVARPKLRGLKGATLPLLVSRIG
ncbi:hypothetical protein GALMADRAFT_572553 [Galerina marginata CBS 339.88]|uniref:Cytochrome P450 n=1 Tax=Galerina marginata (strain CBS 339.88) TaxID=685588 RepID=A0A067T2R5_GALM3|nr:hypothetical protein GALMADRAFT_572553 [Galerina marginata CBS 339.88]